MSPTRAQYFYAQNWPARIFVAFVPIVALVVAMAALAPAPDLSTFDGDARSYVAILGLSVLIGFCVAALIGPFVLGPLYHHRGVLNGYPFQPGDKVELLCGPHRGRVVRVVEVWDWRGDLRVDLSDVGIGGGKSFFQFAQVLRRGDA